MKILLPVDGSDYTKRMLSYVTEHTELLGPGHEYVLFTAVPGIPLHAVRFVDRATLDEHYREQAGQVFQAVKAFASQPGWKVREAYGHGYAPEAIAACVAAEKPDLIVMGTHGHSAIGSMIMGSVASGVLARCKVPVLLIR